MSKDSLIKDIDVEVITEPSDAQLTEMGISREEYTKQVNDQIHQIQMVLNGFFDIRSMLNKPEPTDSEIDTLLDIFGNIKYYGILYNQFLKGEILFTIENGKVQVVQVGTSTMSTTEIPKNRVLN